MTKYTVILFALIFCNNLMAKRIPARQIGPGNVNVRSFCLTNNGEYVFAAIENKIKVYEVASGNLKNTIQYKDSSAIQSVALSADSSILVSGLADGVVVLHELANDKYKLIQISEVRITTVDVDINAGLIVSGTFDGEIMLLDTDGLLVEKFKLHDGVVTKAVFSANAKLLVSSGMDGKINIIDLPGRRKPYCLSENNSPSRDVIINNDITGLLSSCDDGKVIKWMIKSDENFAPAGKYKQNGWVSSICYYKDNISWAACTSNGYVNIYTPIGFVYGTRFKYPLNQIGFVQLQNSELTVIISVYKRGLIIIDAGEMKMTVLK
jgi:WD40 repeat protein